MPAIDSLQRQITTAKELQSVVKTMKVLAAASIRQYERAVESLAEYNRTIEMGLQIVLGYAGSEGHNFVEIEPAINNRLAAVILGSDQGMCGQFNEQITHYAINQIEQLPIAPENRTIVTVGARVIAPLENAKVAITSSFNMPSSLAGITPMVQELLLQIEAWRQTQQINRIILFYNQPRSNTSYSPHTLHLLPLDRTWLSNLQEQPWNSRTLPIFTMERSRLFSELIGQYFFISLYRAFAESLASENASRLAAMQVAEQNIEERLAEFNAQFQQLRQATITEEILEIVAGSEALAQSGEIANG